MKKLTAVFVVACVFTLFGVGSAQAAESGTARPFRCDGTGTFVFDPGAGTVSFSNVQVCTHLGLSTSQGSGSFSSSGGSFSFPWVAANGDVLKSTVVSTVSELTQTSFTLTNAITFNGGTGRFQEASGSVMSVDHATISPDNPLVYTNTFTAEGTISY